MYRHDPSLIKRGVSVRLRSSIGLNSKFMAGSFLTAYVFTLNLITGTGVLAIPYAFFHAGYGLGVIIILIVSFFGAMTMCWHFEAQMRAFKLATAFQQGIVEVRRSGSNDPASAVEALNDSGPTNELHLLASLRPVEHMMSVVRGLNGDFTFEKSNRTDLDVEVDYDQMEPCDFLEISEVALLFGGRAAAWLWNGLMTFYVLSATWVYVVVVGTTAVYGIPIAGKTSRLQCNAKDASYFERTEGCMEGYYIFIFCFWLIISVLTMRDWKFMKAIQKFLTIMVYGLIFTMILTCTAGLCWKFFKGEGHTHSKGGYPQPTKVFNFGEFSDLYGVAIFAMVCHTGSTFVLRNMPRKRLIKRVYYSAFGTIALFYITLALTVALYIGEKLNRVASINWANYNEWGIENDFGLIVGSIVLFFPIVSITCTSVVFLRSMSDALEVMMPWAWKEAFVSRLTCGRRHYIPFWMGDEKWSVFPLQLALRFFLTTLPVIVGYVSFKFEQAMAIAGFLAFGVLFGMPLLLQAFSQRTLYKLQLADIPFRDVTSHYAMCGFVFFLMIACAGYYIYSQILPAFE